MLKIGQHIEGWMSPEELVFLHEKARDMKSVVEIGSYKGRSTYALCASECSLVISIDPHYGGTFKSFIANLSEFNNLKYYTLSSDDAESFIHHTDMLFIDGNHEYEAVLHDLELYAPKTKKLVCGHDYIPEWPGVIQAVEDYFKRKPDFVQNTIWGYWINNEQH